MGVAINKRLSFQFFLGFTGRIGLAEKPGKRWDRNECCRSDLIRRPAKFLSLRLTCQGMEYHQSPSPRNFHPAQWLQIKVMRLKVVFRLVRKGEGKN